MSSLNRFVKVLYDFEPSLPDEMQVKEGELLLVRPAEGEEWLLGLKLKEKGSGLVPATFVTDADEDEGESYRMLYAYEARDENELSVEEGAAVKGLFVGEEWLLGKRADGLIGLLPKNYCQLSCDDENDTSAMLVATESANVIVEEAEEENKEVPEIPVAPVMPSVILTSKDLSSVRIEERKDEEVPVKICEDPITQKIKESEERLKSIKEYQKSKQKEEKEQFVPSEVVRATPLPKSEGFKLPPVHLKKPSAEVKMTTPKVKGPTLVEATSPDKQEKPITKSNIAATRLWTDASGSFKVEASYEKLEGENVHLRKTNGSKISVPLAKLSHHDIEYVHMREGLPMPEPPVKNSTHVNGFDWLKFVLEAGIPPNRALNYAEKLASEGFDEWKSSLIDRKWMERKDFETVDILLLERALKEMQAVINGESLEDRMMKALEAINLKVDQVASSKQQEQSALVSYQAPNTKKQQTRTEILQEDEDDDLPAEVTNFLAKVSSSKGSQHPVTIERRVYKYQQQLVAPPPPQQPHLQPNYPMYPQQQQMSMMMPPPPPAPVMMVPNAGYSYAAPPPPPQVPMMHVAYYQQPPPPPPTQYYAPPQAYYAPPPPPPPQQPYYYYQRPY